MRRGFALAATTLLALLLFPSCSERRSDGFRPPPTADPWGAWETNWSPLQAVSGAWRVSFRYADGKKVPLLANMVVERLERSFIELRSDRGMEAIVVLKPDTINLVNQRDRYYLEEANTPENSDRVVGLYLPPREVAAVLNGRGIETGSYDQLYKDPSEEGGIFVSGFHAAADLRLEAYIDAFGRLRSVRFTDVNSDRPVVAARYFSFRLDRKTGIVWPGVIEIDLLRHGEQVTFRASDVDINPTGLDFKFIFTTRAHRRRLRLEDVPPGPPLLYNSAKEYVK